MDRTYDRERLIDKIMDIYDPTYSDLNKCERLKNMVDKELEKVTVKKSKLEKLVASLQDDYLLITYDVVTNITDEGHDSDGTVWVDLSISIDDVLVFTQWLQDTFDETKDIDSQDEIESLLSYYLHENKVSFGDIGLRVIDYSVN